MAASKNLTPAQLKQRAQHAAHVRWSKTPLAERRRQNAPGLRAIEGRFLKQVIESDPEGRLSQEDRLLLAASARKAWFAKLSYQGSRASQRRSKARKTAAAQAPSERA